MCSTRAPESRDRRSFRPVLLDEKSRPDFRGVYGRLIEEAEGVDIAIRKIRLSGISLGRSELEGPRRIRLLLSQINIVALAAEGEAMASDRAGRGRLIILLKLMASGVIRVRSSPLGGWAPDFSIFHRRGAGPVLLAGPHWFARPYPHRGPALASVHYDREAARIGRRFDGIWQDGHEVGMPLQRVLQSSLDRVPAPAQLDE